MVIQDKFNLKQELHDRLDNEAKLREALNKIIAKLNYERSEAEHWAI